MRHLGTTHTSQSRITDEKALCFYYASDNKHRAPFQVTSQRTSHLTVDIDNRINNIHCSFSYNIERNGCDENMFPSLILFISSHYYFVLKWKCVNLHIDKQLAKFYLHGSFHSEVLHIWKWKCSGCVFAKFTCVTWKTHCWMCTRCTSKTGIPFFQLTWITCKPS